MGPNQPKGEALVVLIGLQEVESFGLFAPILYLRSTLACNFLKECFYIFVPPCNLSNTNQ
jgi:hypothetical protein